MGETLQPVVTGFNKSLRVESRAERLTGDAGAVVLREIMDAERHRRVDDPAVQRSAAPGGCRP